MSHPNQMPEPPQTFFVQVVWELWLYSKLFPEDRAHPASGPGHPVDETHFSCLDPEYCIVLLVIIYTSQAQVKVRT